MKIIKKVIVSSALAVALVSATSSTALTEESGLFAGVGAGYGMANIHSHSGSSGTDVSIDFKDKGIAYEVIAGYKHFFTPSLGFRLFGSFIYTDAKHKADGISTKANVMTYSANFDALYNLITSEPTNLGIFVGIGVGANTWGGKAFDDIPDNIKTTKTSFDFALNVGLRGVFAKHHGVEIAARVPFEEQYIYNFYLEQLIVAYKYNVGARYIYNF
ncbi:outer membrane protein [Helicobacter sp. MIT 21-1697]|uniref:outer membrane protein n=1 Tax=Helicobacter sp. MIT 21-1697 TaxID=2993733 RepID=UPI00224AB22A|nr:outer membrane protein [Helicobacter sp. MIT 21-1697]MCX2716591.1 outer membrane protein [Helicobacter sp. MIT 21-1697]